MTVKLCAAEIKKHDLEVPACFLVRDPVRFGVICSSGKCGYGIPQWICWNDNLIGDVIMIQG